MRKSILILAAPALMTTWRAAGAQSAFWQQLGDTTLTRLVAEGLRAGTDVRAAAPEPVASISGMTPMMKANAVIRIGRKRSRAASMAASSAGLPWSRDIFANSTIRIAFFAARPISMTRPIST